MPSMASVPVQRSPRLQRPQSPAEHRDLSADSQQVHPGERIAVAGIEVGLVSGLVAFSDSPAPMTRRQARDLVTALERLIGTLTA